MWSGNWTHFGMSNVYPGGWHWLMTFQGVVCLFFLGVSLVFGFALFRDWQRHRNEDSISKNSVDETEYTEPTTGELRKS
jgi:hypothetical protein